MRVGNKIKLLFSNLLRRDQIEDTLDAELRAYVEEVTERNIIRGMRREEALRRALVEAGGIEQIKEDVRDVWLGHEIETALPGPSVRVPVAAAVAGLYRSRRCDAGAWNWRQPHDV